MKRSLLLIASLVFLAGAQEKPLPKLTVGYVKQDHHTALFTAALNPERTKKDIGIWLEPVEAKSRYSLMENGKKLADVDLVAAPGGGKMLTLLAQGQFDISLGGIAAMANSVDKGAAVAVISPLHSRGNMLVMKTGVTASNWKEFVAYVNSSDKPVRIGYKDPVSVARIIFEKGLSAEGIAFAGESKPGVKVVTVNMKGEEFLNPGISNGLIDGYVSNNPWAAIAEEKGVGTCTADLDQLPPGTWKDHPCCAVAATNEVVAGKPTLVKKMLMLMIMSTSYMEQDRTVAEKAASEWLGTSAKVEHASIETSGFGMRPTPSFKKNLSVWVDEMNAQKKLSGRLKNKKLDGSEKWLFNFTLLNAAYADLEKKGFKNLP